MNLSLKYSLLTWYSNLREYKLAIQEKRRYLKSKRISVSSISPFCEEKINSDLSEIRLFAIMRNESLRLPYFLKYYKNLHINRFFIIDNDSTDNSVDIALSYENVHVFNTNEPYQKHWYWMEYLLEKYGKNHWCVVVDIDEIFYFPHAEILSISHLCDFLENMGSTAVRSLLLDTYSDQSVQNTVYVAGQNPLNSVPYFDIEHYEVKFPYFDRFRWEVFESTHFTGGMRERVFGKNTPITSLNKFPLFKNTSGTYLGQGMHAINGSKMSNLQGVVFHTKFMQDFIQEAKEESTREQHFNNASDYKAYQKKIECTPDLCLANSNSIRFRDSEQLVELGLMRTNVLFEDFFLSKFSSLLK